MTMSQLLLRGMLIGIVAGLIAFTFAKVYGEPQVNRSIAFESAEAEAKAKAAVAKGEKPEPEDPEIWSRGVQSTIGLFTGVVTVGAALGGIFSLLFALCYGRFTSMGPKRFALLLAAICFVAVYLVPDLKYPANPPAIGQPDTIVIRTELYFSMILISIIAMIASISLKRVLAPRFDEWEASLLGFVAFVVLIAISYYALPVINEVPEGFPAQTLWKFRLDSLGIQALLWGLIGVGFGILTERHLVRSGEMAPPPNSTIARS